jgi:membrane fusion protein (multidrug efflux system)
MTRAESAARAEEALGAGAVAAAEETARSVEAAGTEKTTRKPGTMIIEKQNPTMDVGTRAFPAPRGGQRGILLAALLLLPLGLWACGGAQAEGADEETGYVRVLNVEVATVDLASFTEIIRITGSVQADRDVVISAEESGIIREILVDKGQWVQAGQAMFRMDAEILGAQVEQARALSNMARETWERRKRLYEEDRVGSELVYLEAKYAAEQADANLRLLEERLARTVIRAPIAGVLDTREIEVGTMVGAGTPVARIVDSDPVRITGGMPERYATDVRTGSEATVTFDVMPEEAFSGRISYVGAVVNPRNRTFPVELRLPNPGGMIKPEMVANVEVVRRTLDEAMVVPQEALVRVESGYIVFVVETEGDFEVVRAHPVELGPSQQNRVVIRSGIGAGDRLIVVGQQLVAAGDRVNVVRER